MLHGQGRKRKTERLWIKKNIYILYSVFFLLNRIYNTENLKRKHFRAQRLLVNKKCGKFFMISRQLTMCMYI